MMLQSKPLLGDISKTLSLGELILSETAYAPFARLPEHSHDFTYFCFVLKGSYTERFDSRDYLCQSSSLIYHSRKDSHSDRFYEAGGVCFNIQPGSFLMSRIDEYLRVPAKSKVINNASVLDLSKKIYNEFRSPDDFSQLAIEGIVMELFAEISRGIEKAESRPRWLEMVRELLEEHFRESLNLNHIAGAVGRHPVHLAREFRRYFHCTIGEYVRQLRIDFAIKELSKSRSSISEIALNAGFSQQSHFTKTFKQATGKTPNEFRQSLLLR